MVCPYDNFQHSPILTTIPDSNKFLRFIHLLHCFCITIKVILVKRIQHHYMFLITLSVESQGFWTQLLTSGFTTNAPEHAGKHHGFPAQSYLSYLRVLYIPFTRRNFDRSYKEEVFLLTPPLLSYRHFR